MDKYIKVDWPDSQKFIDYQECFYGFPKEEYNGQYCYFVPEDLYNEVMNNIPKVYESANLGTITFYKDYAIVDNHYFWYDREPQKNDKLLIYNKTKDYKIVTCVASQEGFPILTDDKEVAIGLFDKLIGSYDPEIPF